jgi:hypothetical protein
MVNGPIPEGLVICHRCDNPSCVNPAHLFLGTHADNVADKMRKGRHRTNPHKGEDHRSAKLTQEQVLEVRRRFAVGGISKAALGREYGVTQTTIDHIILRATWRHLPE